MKDRKLKRVGNEARVIGRNLMLLRQASGVTQREVAARLGSSFQQVQKYESGKNRIPAEKLHILKLFFDVPYEVFFEGLQYADQGEEYSAEKAEAFMAARLSRIEDRVFQKRLLQAFLILSA